MKLKLDKPLKGLDGNYILDDNDTPVLMSKLVADRLVGGKSEEPIKMFDYAVTLFKEGSIEVDATDLEKIKTKLGDADLTTLALAQILKAIKAVEIKETVKEHNKK